MTTSRSKSLTGFPSFRGDSNAREPASVVSRNTTRFAGSATTRSHSGVRRKRPRERHDALGDVARRRAKPSTVRDDVRDLRQVVRHAILRAKLSHRRRVRVGQPLHGGRGESPSRALRLHQRGQLVRVPDEHEHRPAKKRRHRRGQRHLTRLVHQHDVEVSIVAVLEHAKRATRRLVPIVGRIIIGLLATA